MKINDILRVFKEYDIQYHEYSKTLIINKPIYVEDLFFLRKLLSDINKKIKIMINSNKDINY